MEKKKDLIESDEVNRYDFKRFVPKRGPTPVTDP
jgi:hypothetical protein